MAQTKRRRQTKHRGNAAGVVESRGRTGRKPTAAERSPEGRAQERAKAARVDRLDRPPSWRTAFYKGMAGAVILLLFLLVLGIATKQAVAFFPVVLAMYTGVSYYSDLWLYRRRMRKKAGSSARPPGPKVGSDGGAA
jgi:hypothetical protein